MRITYVYSTFVVATLIHEESNFLKKMSNLERINVRRRHFWATN